MVKIDENSVPPPRKPCKKCKEKLEVIMGYCGVCYAKDLQKAYDDTSSSKLIFRAKMPSTRLMKEVT